MSAGGRTKIASRASTLGDHMKVSNKFRSLQSNEEDVSNNHDNNEPRNVSTADTLETVRRTVEPLINVYTVNSNCAKPSVSKPKKFIDASSRQKRHFDDRALKPKSMRAVEEVENFSFGKPARQRPSVQMPDNAKTTTGGTTTRLDMVAVVEYADEEDAILVADEEVHLQVTMDSGSVVNVMNPEDLPSGCEVQKGSNNKNFVGANGGVITNHGKADTQMLPDDSNGPEVRCRWDCADVTRPLISTGVTCDSGYEVLSTKTEALVVPEGSLSKFLKQVNVVQRYTRKNKGLYTATVKMRAPKAQGFARPSNQ